MTVEEIEKLQSSLQNSFDLLVEKINKVQIGTKKQFPYGWGNAAKGRTVWRIVEELVTQNLKKHYLDFNLKEITVSNSEVSIFDFECKLKDNNTPIFINIKSAVLDGVNNRDDISKGTGLKEFYKDDINKNFFIGTFFIKFNTDMTIEIDHVTIFPIVWLKDIYINPSNNGNLQSAYCKNIDYAEKRSNADFHAIFLQELEFAELKKGKIIGDQITHPNGKYYKKIGKKWCETDSNGNILTN